jgi:hypothetical protein
MNRRWMVAALMVACGMGGVAGAQDSRTAVESLAKRLNGHRKLVAHGCGKCQSSGTVNAPKLDGSGYKTKPAPCPDCDGKGLILVEEMVNKVQGYFWKPALYLPKLWPGNTGYGKEEYAKFPRVAAHRLNQAFGAGWIVDDSAIEKVGEYEEVDGVGHIAVKIRGGAPPSTLHFYKFDEGWKIVPEAEASLALRTARPANGGGRRRGEGRDVGGQERPVSDVQRSDRFPNRTAAVRGPGRWRIENGELIGVDNPAIGATKIRFGNPEWSRYVVTARAKAVRPGRARAVNGFIFDVHVAPNWDEYIAANFGFQGNRRAELSHWVGTRRALIDTAPGSVKQGEWQDVRIVVDGESIELQVDGETVYKCAAVGRRRGQFGFTSSGCEFHIKDIRIVGLDGTVLWEGLPQLP